VAYTVEPLRFNNVEQAYPLMQALEPGLDLDGWRRLCRNNIGRSRIFVAIAATGYFHALCFVEAVSAENGPSALAVSRLIIDDVVDPVGVAVALLDALVGQAARLGCERVRISTAGADEAALSALAEARAQRLPTALPIETI
jgi:hypothetical protein